LATSAATIRLKPQQFAHFHCFTRRCTLSRSVIYFFIFHILSVRTTSHDVGDMMVWGLTVTMCRCRRSMQAMQTSHGNAHTVLTWSGLLCLQWPRIHRDYAFSQTVHAENGVHLQSVSRKFANLASFDFCYIFLKRSVGLIRRSIRTMRQGHINRILGQFKL
jgi:hypothetical protein